MDKKYGHNVMLVNNATYRYERPYNGPFLILQCWANVTVTLQCDPIRIGYNVCCIKPYMSETIFTILNI